MESKQKADLPSVLVVGISPWREDAAVHTLLSIFSCWDPEKLSLIYTKSGLPYTDAASRFFQISENEVLKNLPKPWVTVGKEVESTKLVDENLTREEDARYAKAHKHHSMVLTFCREFVWMLGHWRSRALDKFIQDVHPEVLFIPVYPTVYMGWIQRYVIKKARKPFVCYLADDNYSYASCKGVLSYLHRFWLRKNVRWLATHCEQMFVIVDKEKEETDKLFGTRSVILTKSIDFSNRPYHPYRSSSPIRFVYTGSLIIGREKTMAKIADAINRINNEAGIVKAYLDIYSGDVPADEIMAHLNTGASRHCGTLTRPDVARVQSGADVVIFAEALEGKEANVARLSFSTKITDYLANGKCILAVGKKGIAPMDYFEKNDSAIVAYSEQDIYAQILNIVNHPEMMDEYGRKAYDCGVRNHDKQVVDARLIDTICKVAGK